MIIRINTSRNPKKKSMTGLAVLPTETQAIANTILKKTIGMISYLTAASTIFGGNKDNRYEEKGTGFRSTGEALARIRLGAIPTPGLKVFSRMSPMVTATETLNNT